MKQYRKNYLVVCDGKQEQMYLEHLAKLIKDFPRKVVKFNSFVDSPYRLKKRYEEYDSAALFDYDFNDVEFKKNIEFCDGFNKKLKPTKRKTGKHVYHAYSNVNFDLWLILHKANFCQSVSTNNAYVSEVRKIYGLGHMDNIKGEDVIKKILDQVTLDNVKAAIKRADNIRKNKIETDGFKICNTILYPNPDFSIHEFLKVVLQDSGDI